MKYEKDMLLESQSGFAMPFMATQEEEVQVTLPYGEQIHPLKGEKFLHAGIDLVCSYKELFALASGTIVGVGKDAIHAQYVIAKYGSYEVKYGHVSEVYCNYGTQVEAGTVIAKSGEFLHIGVRYKGQDLNPVDLLNIIHENIIQLENLGMKASVKIATIGDGKFHTNYDADQEEILNLLMRWLPAYMTDLRRGTYQPSARLENILRNVFAQSASKGYFFENIPTISNPLGLGEKAIPLCEKVQNNLIADFLNYLALVHDTYLSSWTEEQKKSLESKPKPTE